MNRLSINSSLNDRISAFAKAGSLLSLYLEGQLGNAENKNAKWQDVISKKLLEAEAKNNWFTPDNLRHALEQWSAALTEENLNSWLEPYHLSSITPKTISIIAAGNIPLVAFHDVLCVVIAGHHAQIKYSTNDDVLLPMLLEMATEALPELNQSYSFVKGKLEQHDAVIATGSNNTARYFEHYFGGKPNIIRKNRNSLAVLTGEETLEDMQALSRDVFQYFGLGCRSVSHIKVPHGFNFDLFFNGMYEQRELIKNAKYVNNYDYNKAVYLMSEFDLLDNEFLLLKQEDSYSSPIASLGYSYYQDQDTLLKELTENAEQLQCVVAGGEMANSLESALGVIPAPTVVDFGTTQQPGLKDYADGVDTMAFLLTLS
ncbi:acyl-CoA reductase [Nonlabens xiamenensis]|uniref:acyl-CoA reductase n=1 Tax=Nonlabens xiamenensis TaxID=2341043 RepID=UPI000F607167|nr:acyl-CoA reductase [Nonlabens xiamenensis]